jgi:hypothetical protein
MSSDQSQARSNQPQIQAQVNDEIYLRIWEREQEHVRTRWTVTTFFLSVSFAIFGFSFQQNLALSSALAIRLASLIIYWFAYSLFMRFYDHTRFLRSYLKEMETAQQTSLHLESRASMRRPYRGISTRRSLLFLGIVYTIGVGVLWLLRL